MAMLRLELFVHDLGAAQDFYERVLGFDRSIVRADGYTVMRLDGVQIDLQPVEHLSDGHPAKPSEGERVGLGVEIVLEVADVHVVSARVVESGWPIAKPLIERPWGLTDFRALDPDGRYVRVTSSA
ncbi:MAG: VOC family protein [Anaerolineae bacterium]|nr:VOC family protein [Anaerolineae bacterium]